MSVFEKLRFRDGLIEMENKSTLSNFSVVTWRGPKSANYTCIALTDCKQLLDEVFVVSGIIVTITKFSNLIGHQLP